MNPYLDAVRRIPCGETRSFMEVAVMAGRPGAARAAGRAIAASTRSSTLPLHRVVSSQGNARDTLQLRRLRREGARPRSRESLARWAKRTGARLCGCYRTRTFTTPAQAGALGWNPEQVEALPDESRATARGFSRVGRAKRRETPLPKKGAPSSTHEPQPLSVRCADLGWNAIREALAQFGGVRLKKLLTPSECAKLLYVSSEANRFERTIDMLPRGYGVGTYHYYREPLPNPARDLREVLYRELAPAGYPETIEAFWERCREAEQSRSSSILIGYEQGGINHPHRDVYGPVSFPFQALIALSKRGRDFSGGDFYVEDDDSARSRQLFKVSEGDVVLFATRDRRVGGRKVPVRHGMTLVTKGTRYGLGLVFHLAE